MATLNVHVPIAEITECVRDRTVGLLSNATAWLEQIGDDLTGAVRNVAKKTVLLASEHGTRCDGSTGKPEATARDPYTGCEVRTGYEYYSAKRRQQILADLDLLLVGLHDIGCRHYTYKATMGHLLKIASVLGKPVVVVDLPNPVRGDIVEGNYPRADYYETYFAGVTDYLWCAAPLAYRHGMTCGEMALMSRDYLDIELDLRIIRMAGWRRDMWWDETGWPYIRLDPSIYSTETTLGFLCTGLLQGTNVSWGIGTADPFRVVGAPWIEDDRLLHALRDRQLAGVTWTRAHFMPRWRQPGSGMWSRFAFEPCNGVRLHVTDRDAVCTAAVQLSLLVELCRLYPDAFVLTEEGHDFDRRLEDPQWSRRLSEGEGVDSILLEWQEMSKAFEKLRAPYLLY